APLSLADAREPLSRAPRFWSTKASRGRLIALGPPQLGTAIAFGSRAVARLSKNSLPVDRNSAGPCWLGAKKQPTRHAMKVCDAMTPDVQLCTPEDSLKDAAEAMAALNVGLLPVTENDRLVGMVSDRDIA